MCIRDSLEVVVLHTIGLCPCHKAAEESVGVGAAGNSAAASLTGRRPTGLDYHLLALGGSLDLGVLRAHIAGRLADGDALPERVYVHHDDIAGRHYLGMRQELVVSLAGCRRDTAGLDLRDVADELTLTQSAPTEGLVTHNCKVDVAALNLRDEAIDLR